MAKKRHLTWHRPSRRWKKQIDGVVYHFGYGKSESDTKAYKLAEKKYLQFIEERERKRPVEIPLAKATVADIAEKYVQQLESRHRRVKQINGHAPNGESTSRTRREVSASYVSRVASCLHQFLGFVGSDKLFHSVSALALEDYRNHVLALPVSEQTGRPISPRTAKDRLAEVKAFMVWAYEMELCDLPRNLRRYAQVDLPEPTPTVFTSEELGELWKASSQRMRCLMALALNCGFGQQDLSDLRVGEIDFTGQFIDRRRSKTGVRARHKLWPMTVALLKKELDGDAQDDLAFRTASGTPLVTSELRDGKLKRSDTVKCQFWRLMRKVKLDGGRGFYSLRKTGASQIERIDPAVTEMYLAHSERGMKRNYAERDWDRLGRTLDQLETHFNLKA